MSDPELGAIAREVVERLAEVTADEDVIVIADPDSVDVGEAFVAGARTTGATTSLLVMPKLDTQGDEPPDSVAGTMRGADVVFAVNEHSLGHTEARKRATDAGTRVSILRGIDEGMMTEGAMTADFDAVREDTGAVVNAMTAADRAHVRTPTGTDVEMSLDGRTAFPLDGFFHESAGFANLPPGLAVSSPVDGSVEGTIVMDHSMDGFGRLDGAIELEVSGGMVVDVRGGRDAGRLRDLLEGTDSNAGNVAEFAIGTNAEARLIGNLAEDKKRRGVVDFALGDNTSIGGHTESDVHLDFIVLDATTTLDDVVVQEEGDLDLEAIRRVT